MKANFSNFFLVLITIGSVVVLSFWQLTNKVFAYSPDPDVNSMILNSLKEDNTGTGWLKDIKIYSSDQALIIDFLDEKDNDGKLVFGGSYTLRPGEVLDSDLVVMGGEAILQEGSIVNGAVVLFGGTLRADGEITGELVSFGGQVELGDTAKIEGDAVSFGGDFSYSENTEFGGELISEFPGPKNFKFSDDFDISNISPSGFWPSLNPFIEVMWLFLRSFIWAALAIIVLLFLEKPVERISDTVVMQPVVSGGLGLLTSIVAPVLLVALTITIIGIPLSLVLVFILGIAWALGIVSIGYLVGNRIARMLNQSWAEPVNAGAGAFILTFVINGIGLFVPCVGWLIPAMVGVVGLGAVVLTRFGTQSYPVTGNAEMVEIDETKNLIEVHESSGLSNGTDQE